MQNQFQSHGMDDAAQEQLDNNPTGSNSAPLVPPTCLCDNNSSVDISRETAILLLNEAIEETIPYHEKTGYMGALQSCPQLIEEESDPLVFLRYEQYNIWAAARRLVKYWEWRAIIFGDIYAYTPILNLQAQKELGNIDFLSILQDGSLIVLPGQDIYGNYLVYADKWRLHLPFEEMDKMRILRVAVYTWTLMIVHSSKTHKKSILTAAPRERGVILIDMFYEVPSTTKHFMEAGTNLKSLLTEAVPFDAPIQHVIFMANKKTDWTALIGIVAPVVLSIGSRFYSFFKQIIPHVCLNAQSVLNELKAYGITDISCLPESIGGSWPLSNYDQWFQKQLNLNTNTLHLGGLQKEEDPNYAAPAILASVQRKPLITDKSLSMEHNSRQDVDVGDHSLRSNSSAPLDTNYCESENVSAMLRQGESVSLQGYTNLNDEDIQTLGTGFVIFVLSTMISGHFILFIDPAKAKNCNSASQRRCFSFCLNCLVQEHSKFVTGTRPSVSIFVFIDDDKKNTSNTSSASALLTSTTNSSLDTMTFGDILKSSPVCLSAVHVVLEPVNVGLLEYQNRAGLRAIQLFSPPLDSISFDILYPGSVSIFQEHGIDQASIPLILGSRWDEPDSLAIVDLDRFRVCRKQSRPNSKRKYSSKDGNVSKESAREKTSSNKSSNRRVLSSEQIISTNFESRILPATEDIITEDNTKTKIAHGQVTVLQRIAIVDFWRRKILSSSDST